MSALRLLLKFGLAVALVWAMATYLGDYFFVTGGWKAYVIVGALLTLMNLVVRPILNLITMPLRLLATILATVLVNGLFVWLTYIIVVRMDPDLVMLQIDGGIAGWIVVAIVLGLGNWLTSLFLKY